ncbi:hypothetical protein L6452_37573 [Arctium lappa]|uniref:Uncharacterized protein n=1 Tax=Arctium lappa TaxID=4217 RepID=A0ACB8Y414_ARCLA|nr:hypothetical protein L6452_37573 [Arctium lappa]
MLERVKGFEDWSNDEIFDRSIREMVITGTKTVGGEGGKRVTWVGRMVVREISPGKWVSPGNGVIMKRSKDDARDRRLHGDTRKQKWRNEFVGVGEGDGGKWFCRKMFLAGKCGWSGSSLKESSALSVGVVVEVVSDTGGSQTKMSAE